MRREVKYIHDIIDEHTRDAYLYRHVPEGEIPNPIYDSISLSRRAHMILCSGDGESTIAYLNKSPSSSSTSVHVSKSVELGHETAWDVASLSRRRVDIADRSFMFVVDGGCFVC